jgi:Holliday junction resolvasome RuvABC endonuclease subunit
LYFWLFLQLYFSLAEVFIKIKKKESAALDAADALAAVMAHAVVKKSNIG